VIDEIQMEYYLDGEQVPSIAFQPALMCGNAFPARIEPTDMHVTLTLTLTLPLPLPLPLPLTLTLTLTPPYRYGYRCHYRYPYS
jgi:hypothetical protein